ncbi:unnamed protein product [Orchesella dallaii]|uniref:Uncharacterized protein n=1 Tax=Orchesella dallaii TaxID=48710 RepID=A0ABP1Q507_9HEXA
MSKMRKSKLVTVCSVDSHRDDGPGTFSSNTIKSRSSKSSWYIKVPINDHNIALYEVYGDSYSKESSPCQKVNFLTLCCKSNMDVNSIRLSYEEYQHVRCVEFTGHVGSMKVAFELLHKFPNVKELIFVLNDNNVKCESEEYRSYKNEDGYVTKALTVEKLSILQDFSVCEKSSKEAQDGGKVWRIDEILYLSRLCIPKIKKFETLLLGNGGNYEKVREFIDCMPFLKKNHSAEISNGYLKVRTTVSSSRTTPAILACVAPPPAALCNTNATVTSNALVPMQSIIKLEKMDEDEEVVVTVGTNDCNLNPYSLQYSRQEQNGTYAQYPQSLVPYNVETTFIKPATCKLPQVHPVPLIPPSANNVLNKQTQHHASHAGLPYFVRYPPSAFVSNGVPQDTDASRMESSLESTQQKNREVT